MSAALQLDKAEFSKGEGFRALDELGVVAVDARQPAEVLERPKTEDDDVEVDETHGSREARDSFGNALLETFGALLLGGGRRWFLPAGTFGSSRSARAAARGPRRDARRTGRLRFTREPFSGFYPRLRPGRSARPAARS